MRNYLLIPISEEKPVYLPVIVIPERGSKKKDKGVLAYVPAFPIERESIPVIDLDQDTLGSSQFDQTS